MDKRSQHEEQRTGSATVEYPIIGKSKAVEQLHKQIARLAKTRKDVLVTGEAGSGKGAVAKNIYLQGAEDGSDHGFLSMNLAVIDDRELEAILSNIQSGSSNGTFLTPAGHADLTHGGTILVEEIEEATFRNQMKILNFMSEQKIRRESGEDDGGDVRFIVTMKSDPGALVEKRKLLEDLYGKIVEFEKVQLIPLRQRPEDIPLLVKHFTSELCREMGISDLVIDINAIDVLMRQPWRENIRELKSVVDKSVLFSTDGRFMLPPELVDEKTEVAKMISNIVAGQEFVLDKSLDVIEKGIIERALERFGFNQSRAAAFLGMTEQTFRYKLKRLGIASARMRG